MSVKFRKSNIYCAFVFFYIISRRTGDIELNKYCMLYVVSSTFHLYEYTYTGRLCLKSCDKFWYQQLYRLLNEYIIDFINGSMKPSHKNKPIIVILFQETIRAHFTTIYVLTIVYETIFMSVYNMHNMQYVP